MIFRPHSVWRVGFVSILAILCSSLFVLDASAMGVSPGILGAYDLAKNNTVERTITVIRPNTQGDWVFAVKLEGDGARYMELSAPTVTIKDGDTSAPYQVLFKTESAPNGSFKASVFFESTTVKDASSDGKSQGYSMGVRQAALVRVNFSVTDQQIRAFKVESVSIPSAEVDEAPVVAYVLRNEGNVDARVDKITALVVNTVDTATTYQLTGMMDETAIVSPGKAERINIPLSQKLPLGKYVAKLDFYKDSEVVLSAEKVYFQVFAEGVLAQKIELDSFTVSSKQVEKGEIVKAEMLFKNTGALRTKTQSYLEIKRDGKTLDIVRGEEKTVAINGEAKTTFLWRPLEKGTYQLEAYGSYAAGETKHLTEEVHVGREEVSAAGKGSKTLWILLGACVLAFLLLLLILLLLLKRRKAKKEQVVQTVVQIPASATAPAQPVAAVQTPTPAPLTPSQNNPQVPPSGSL